MSDLFWFFLRCGWLRHPQLFRMGVTILLCSAVSLLVVRAILAAYGDVQVDMFGVHGMLMAVACLFILPIMLVLQYLPAPADRRTCMPAYKRTYVAFLIVFALALVTGVWENHRLGRTLWPQSTHAYTGMIVVGAVGIGFVYPLFYGAWKKMETGLEMPMGFFISVMGAFAVWSGMWALVGDDTYLALAPLVCVACIAIVRNCTRVKPPDFVYKGDSLVSAGFSVERQPTGGGV